MKRLAKLTDIVGRHLVRNPLSLLALIVASAALWFAVAAIYNPYDTAADIVHDVAQGNTCPSGWRDTSVDDTHTPVRKCERDEDGDGPIGPWVVVLTSEGNFSHGVQLDTPGATIIEDPTLVPKWLD